MTDLNNNAEEFPDMHMVSRKRPDQTWEEAEEMKCHQMKRLHLTRR